MANPIKMKATVSAIRQFGDGVYEVAMATTGTVPRYKPGQFLHLTIDEYDPAGGFWPESRVFSIASAWGSDDIRIVYSVKGRYTKRMEEALRPGSEVWLKLPYGNFIIDSALAAGQSAVLVAGGTGVSPFLPFIEKRLSEGAAPRDVRLYYGARRNAMLIGMDLLRLSEGKGVRTEILVEDEAPVAMAPLRAERGRLDIKKIYSECAAMGDPAFFLSGPPQMITAFKGLLLSCGLSPKKILIDEWE